MMTRILLFLLAVAFPPAAWTADPLKAVLVLRSPGSVPAAVETFAKQYGNGRMQIVVAGEKNAEKELSTARVVFMQHPSAEFLTATRSLGEDMKRRGAVIFVDTPEVVLRHWGIAPPPALNAKVLEYWNFGGEENLAAMLALLYKSAGGALTAAIAPPREEVLRGVYHPRAPRIFPNLKEYMAWYRQAVPGKGKLAVVTFFHAAMRARETNVVDALLAALEGEGLAAAGVFGWPHSTVTPVLEAPPSDGMAVNLNFTLSLSRPEDGVAMERQGVHVISLLTTRASYAEWASSDRGVAADRIGSSLAMPERNGATDPIMVATQEPDAATGMSHPMPIAERVHMAAARARRWIALQEKPNREKRLVILYYNNPAGKGNIGASYLNFPPSMAAVLRTLGQAGYTVGDRLPEAETLIARLEQSGRNIEAWAPGELSRLAEQSGVTILPVAQYRQWFDKLPAQFRDSVNARWGVPEKAELMTLKAADGRRFFVIPGVRFGNVFVGPQLLRASAAEQAKAQHSGTLPPHHGYVASYLYYRHVLGADAVIHMGRHGTLEWLPGKNAGQAGWDCSEVILGDLPNANYYIMDGGGEALQARRRSAAVDISHLTPMLAGGGRQDRFEPLRKAVEGWQGTRETSPQLAEQYRKEALESAHTLKLDAQLGLTPNEPDKTLEKLEEFLEAAEEAPIPLGLPTLGQAPEEPNLREGLLKYFRSGFNPEELRVLEGHVSTWASNIFEGRSSEIPGSLSAGLREKTGKAIDDATNWLRLLRLSPGRELAALVEVLNGRYLPSGPVGDPLGVPGALPSGRNLHDADPALFPTTQAWEVGKRMAGEMLARYASDHGGAPLERVSMVLWSGESGRQQGALEAQALFLMGVRPEWNSRGVVDRLRLIPDAELGRPRVNVLLTASGLYRDTFGDKMMLLDRAARMAAAAGDNVISRQNREVEKALLARGVAAGDAEHLAGARVFATAPGAYGNGISSLVEQSKDKDDPEGVAELYLAKMNYVYTEKVWGTQTPKLLAAQLRGNQVVLHSRSSNLYGVADNDDVYQFVGGLNAASKSVGASPDVMFNNMRSKGGEKLESARQFLANELQTRNWNPKWIEGMKATGYAGARLMANSVENLYGWQATSPEVVDPSVWKKTYDVYVRDEYRMGLPEFMSKANPHAQQKLYARLLEVERQGIMQLTSAEKAQLVSAYVRSVGKVGVACSANVCGNPRLQQYVARQSGAASAEERMEFEKQFREAAKSPGATSPAGEGRPRVSRSVTPSWLKNVTLLDVSPKHAFLQKPFGVEWSIWLLSGVLLSAAVGCIYPLYRRRTNLWSITTRPEL